MLRYLILSLLMAVPAAGADPLLAMGVGLESRIQPDVNPDYSTPLNMPQLYSEILFTRWALELELSQQARTSSSGGLNVDSRTLNSALWGRFELKPPGGWSPFVAVGLGAEFDQVDTGFGTSTDSRSAQRGMVGVGCGLSKVWWKILLVELEARVEWFENSEEPLPSGVLRLGVTTY